MAVIKNACLLGYFSSCKGLIARVNCSFYPHNETNLLKTWDFGPNASIILIHAPMQHRNFSLSAKITMCCVLFCCCCCRRQAFVVLK